MDSNEQFWLALWKYVLMGAAVLIVVSAGSCQMTNYQIRRAIESGAGPMAAKCALSSDAGTCEVQKAAEAEATRDR